MTRFALLIAAAAAALVMAATASATPHRSNTATLRHDRQVITFFDHHRALAKTPLGQRALWSAIHHLNSDVDDLSRQLQAVPVTWLASVATVGRYFGDNIAAWEKSCSSTEGGWGGFVWFGHHAYAIYGEADTPGGNLQFKKGTFDGIIVEAVTNARSRGMHVPSSAISFYSPFGQALAGAQMYLNGRLSEWTGAGC